MFVCGICPTTLTIDCIVILMFNFHVFLFEYNIYPYVKMRSYPQSFYISVSELCIRSINDYQSLDMICAVFFCCRYPILPWAGRRSHAHGNPNIWKPFIGWEYIENSLQCCCTFWMVLFICLQIGVPRFASFLHYLSTVYVSFFLLIKILCKLYHPPNWEQRVFSH